MNFDKKYFDDIWGTVHRHDYCESLADSLIAKYGKVRILSIGDGCGFLVKTLRDKGCDAWGLEISDYALENSCAKGYILKGSVVDIPFKDNSFDVVYSQGLWEYIAEQDIQQAWNECNRVGKIQEHSFDTEGKDTAPWTKDFVTFKPIEWWKKRLKLTKILVAAPTHLVKEYSMQRWLDNVKSLTYPNYDIFISDNSPTEDLVNRWKDRVDIEKIDTRGMDNLSVKRINYSYEAIRQKFLQGNYDRLMIIEIDVIPAPNVIETLLKWGKDSDWIAHAYPARDASLAEADELKVQGIGCSLFSRRLIEKYDFKGFEDNYMADGGMWMKVRPDKTMCTLEMWGYLDDIKHLGS